MGKSLPPTPSSLSLRNISRGYANISTGYANIPTAYADISADSLPFEQKPRDYLKDTIAGQATGMAGTDGWNSMPK